MKWIKRRVKIEDKIDNLVNLLAEVSKKLSGSHFVASMNSYEKLADNFNRINFMMLELKGLLSRKIGEEKVK
jgi:hypothetical protein